VKLFFSFMPSVTEFARAYKTTPNTIRTWTAEFADHLNPAANPPKGQARTYTDQDAQVIALVGEMRQQYAGYEAIHAALRGGRRGTWPPKGEGSPSVEDEPSTALVMRLTALVAHYEGELSAVKQERDRLITERDREREARLAAEKEAARLAGRLEAMEAGRSQAQDGAR
jgi:DNA-binding transcriptional MerR regulator